MAIVYPSKVTAVTVDNDSETLRQALRQMPVPEPSEGFVDRVLANATARSAKPRKPARESMFSRLREFAMRSETWLGAAFGGAVAVAVTLILLRPVDPPEPAISLALHESRNIDVVIDSERPLQGATIRVALTGAVALDGFEDYDELGWKTNLDRGNNLLSLPVVARSRGDGQLVAIIEHQGRTQRVTVNLTVRDPEVSRS